jgi:hypothetical protein
VWGERFFVLRGYTLYYYVKPTDLVRSSLFLLPWMLVCNFISSSINIGAKRILSFTSQLPNFFYYFRFKQKEETVYI